MAALPTIFDYPVHAMNAEQRLTAAGFSFSRMLTADAKLAERRKKT